MESYIVRIYRKAQGEPDELAGLVETVGTSERLSFRTFPELTSVLRRMLRQDDGVAVVNTEQTGTDGGAERVGLNLIAGHKG
jgi:hypothetical protein